MVSMGVWMVLVTMCLQCVLINSHLVVKRDTPSQPEWGFMREALKDEVARHNLPAEQPPRDKRLAIITKTGISALLLNFIFGNIDSALDAKIHWINQLDKKNIAKNEKYFGITTPKPSYTAGSGGPGGAYGPPAGGSSSSTPAQTTPAPIEFSTSSPVSLVIPDRLYGNSFTLVTNISQTIGDVLFNTAGRAQEFADTLSGKVRRNFGFSTNLLGDGKEKRGSSSSKSSDDLQS